VAFKVDLAPASTSSKYPRGKEVMVHYDPDDPAIAVLETGISISSFIPALLGIPLLMIGLTGFILGIMPKKTS